MKQVLLIGGPNGAGKTTAAMTLLPHFLHIHEFVNADEIARGLNPLNPEGQAIPAARIMLDRLKQLTQHGVSFGFETTCAGRQHEKTLAACKAAGYETELIFLWLPSAEMAVRRVHHRVASGGHNIPESVVHRRYQKGIANLLHHYLPLVDHAVIYNNIRPTKAGILPKIAEKSPTTPLFIHDKDAWSHIQETARG